MTRKQHKCRWPGCTRHVAPGRWGCGRHWSMLPLSLRRRLERADAAFQADKQANAGEQSRALLEAHEWAVDYMLQGGKRSA